MTSRSLGTFGESWAAGFLTRSGYHVLERNVRLGRDEIDIVARDGDDLVFIEVKCRRGSQFGLPEESITPARFARLARAAERYVADHGGGDRTTFRIDVLALSVDRSGRVNRHHLIRAAEPPER